MWTEYVLGFLFNNSGDNVILIRKNKPKWQAGKLNGVGGKVEPDESSEDAMLREFEEEAGAVTSWHWFCELLGDEFRVHCFRSFDSQAFDKAATMNSEPIERLDCTCLFQGDCIANLHWLIPLALDRSNGQFTTVTIGHSDKTGRDSG